MASVTYDFNFGEKGMSDEVDYTITVTGDPIPSDAVITSGTFSFTIGLNGYSSSETMRLRKFYINGLENYIGYGKAYGDSTWWDTSNRITFSGNLVISDSSPSAFTSGSFSLLLQLSYGGTFSGVNGRQGSITINYTEITYTQCGAPSDPTLSASQTTDSAELSWKAGSGGTNNTFTGYVITYKDSADGSTWDEVKYYGETTGTSMTVNAPSTVGYYRKFGIQTKGTAGEYWYSDVIWSGSLKKISAPSALPVWYNGTQLTSITVVKNGVPTKITSLTVVQNGVSTKVF